MDKEREIYIKDMLFSIFRKWRVILVWMVIFAVALDGVAVAKSYKTMVESRNAQKLNNEKLENYKGQLSKEDIKKVEDTYELYVTYNKSLENSLDYYNNSVKMQLNPNNIATISLQYGIYNSKMRKDIVKAYSNAVLSKETCEYINEKAELKTEANYVCELINFDVNDEVYEKNNSNNTVNVIEDTDGTSMLINIIAPDKNSCEIIADIMEDKIQENTSKIQKKLGDFHIKKIDRNFVNKASESLLNEQQNCISSINNIKTTISNLNLTLSDVQKSYYSALISQDSDDVEGTESNINTSVKMINLKYIFVGLAAGVFFVACWYGLFYIINENLKIKDELEEYYGLSVMETMQSEKTTLLINRSFIDRLIYKLFKRKNHLSKEESIDLVCTNILIAARKQNMKRVHITGCADSECAEGIKMQILEKIKNNEESLKCSIGKSIIRNVDSLNTLADSEGIVLIEEINNSDFYEIGKEINICMKNSVNIIGAVVIE